MDAREVARGNGPPRPAERLAGKTLEAILDSGVLPRRSVAAVRPREAWRSDTGLVNDPAGTKRRTLRYSREEIDDLVERLCATPPSDR